MRPVRSLLPNVLPGEAVGRNHNRLEDAGPPEGVCRLRFRSMSIRRAATRGTVVLVAIGALATMVSMTGRASAASLALAKQTATADKFPCSDPKKPCRPYTLTVDKLWIASPGPGGDSLSLYGDVTVNDSSLWSYADGDGPDAGKGYQIDLSKTTFTTYVQTDHKGNPVWQNPASFKVAVDLTDDDNTWWNPFSTDDAVASGTQVIDPAAYYSDPFWFTDPMDPTNTPISDEVVFGAGGGSVKMDYHWTPGKTIPPSS